MCDHPAALHDELATFLYYKQHPAPRKGLLTNILDAIAQIEHGFYCLRSKAVFRGGGTPLYKACRYVPPHRVGFLRRFGLETGIQSAHFEGKNPKLYVFSYTDLFEWEWEWYHLSFQMGSIQFRMFLLAEAGNTYINSCLKIILVSCYHSDHYKHLSAPTIHGEDIIEIQVLWIHP